MVTPVIKRDGKTYVCDEQKANTLFCHCFNTILFHREFLLTGSNYAFKSLIFWSRRFFENIDIKMASGQEEAS